MVCSWCGYHNPLSARFCGDCGRPLRFDLTCSACGTQNPSQHSFCDACGALLTAGRPAQPQAPARTRAEQLLPALRRDLASLLRAYDSLSAALLGRLKDPAEYLPPQVWEAVPVVPLTALALTVRLYGLAQSPPGLHGDEANFGMEAMRIASGQWLGAWSPVNLGHPTGHMYFMALVIKLSHPSIFTVRLATAIMGTLSIPVAYGLFRLLFAPRVALPATALLALSFWHVAQSRMGWAMAPAVSIFLASLYLFFLGWRTSRQRYFVLSGIFLGLGFYIHKSYPFYYVGMWAFTLPRAFYGASLTERRGALWCLLASLASAAPFLGFFLRNQDHLMDLFRLQSFFETEAYRSAEGLVGKLLALGDRAKDILLYLHNPVPWDGADGTGGFPLLDRATESFFWLGLLVALLRLRKPAYQLVAFAALVGFVPSMMVIDGQARRVLGALPFVMAIAAIGLDVGVQALLGAVRRLSEATQWRLDYRAVGAGVAVLGVGGFLSYFGYINTDYYFGRWTSDSAVKWTYVYDLVKAMEYVKTLNNGTFVYFYSDRWSYNYETRRFLAPDVPGEDRSQRFAGEVSLERQHGGSVVYLLMRGYLELVPQLQELYPGGSYYEARDSDGEVLFAAYSPG